MQKFLNILLILLALVTTSCIEATAPQRAEKFFTQEAQFEQLGDLVYKANGGDMGKLSSTEVDTLFELLKKFGIQNYTWQDGCKILFLTYAGNSPEFGIQKGYAYLCAPPVRVADAEAEFLVADIDHYPNPNLPPNDPYYIAYQPLKGRWYLFERILPRFR